MKLRKIYNTNASHPFLRSSISGSFLKLRNLSHYETEGLDILNNVELSKPRNYVDNDVNISYRSRLKCGDAFVITDTSNLVITQESIGRLYSFRLWAKPLNQSGRFGQKMKLTDTKGKSHEGYFVDFTELAESCEWRRLPTNNPNNFTQITEFHSTEGLSYEEAMLYLYSKFPKLSSIKDARKSPYLRVIGLNDRGSAVKNIQERLRSLNLMSYADINGIFDKKMQTVVKEFQEHYRLDTDGLVGEDTRKILYALTEREK